MFNITITGETETKVTMKHLHTIARTVIILKPKHDKDVGKRECLYIVKRDVLHLLVWKQEGSSWKKK